MKLALSTLAALLLATTAALADDCGCKPRPDFGARAALTPSAKEGRSDG